MSEYEAARQELGSEERIPLNRRLRSCFDGRIVRKDLTKSIKEGANVPVYVLEFLLGQYCSSDDPEDVAEGVSTVKRILSENYVRPDEAQKTLSILRERGSYTVIDRITAHLNIKDEKFSIPENVYIIGMMNTADRSLAMMDYALRRRFGFFEIKPGFEADQFRAYRMGLGSEKFDKLIACVESLNNAIVADESLGEGFCIGHSYFCNLKEVTDRALNSIVEFELIPLLKEYWFDEPLKVKDWISNLRSAIK